MAIKYYHVGGSVRDSFLKIKSKDLDFAVEAPSYTAMKEDVIARGGKLYLEKPEFLTIRAKMPNVGDADFVLCRKDGAYGDGRRPDSVEPGTIFDDLARRDFTVNAIAREMETGEILDPHDGQKDIDSMTLRCVGRAHDRFSEDSLRMLRALRFTITKNFRHDEEIHRCFGDIPLVEKLMSVSGERVREELAKMFAHNTGLTLAYLNQYQKIADVIFYGFKIELSPIYRPENVK